MVHVSSRFGLAGISWFAFAVAGCAVESEEHSSLDATESIANDQAQLLAQKSGDIGTTLPVLSDVTQAATAAATGIGCPASIKVTTTETGSEICNTSKCTLNGAVWVSNRCEGTQEIVIPKGTYTLAASPELRVVDSTRIRGESSSNTIISGGDQSGIFKVYNSSRTIDVEISELSLVKGRAASGAAVYSPYGTNLTLNSVTIADNVATSQGGGVYIGGSNGRLSTRDSVIRNNSAGNSSGGVHVVQHASAVLTNTSLYSNSSISGGAFGGGGDLYLVNSFAVFNKATEKGGAGDLFVGSFVSINSLILGNEAKRGGGISLSTGSTATLLSSTLSYNKASERGGALDLTNNVHLNVRSSVIELNEAAGDGGAIASYDGAGQPSDLAISSTLFRSNSALNWGGAIKTLNSAVHVSRVSFIDNSATWGGAVYVQQTPATFFNSTFQGNTAHAYGSSVFTSLDKASFKNCTIINNDSDAAALSGHIPFSIIELSHTIVASETGKPTCDFDENTTQGAVSHGYNLDSSSSCRLRAATDLSSTSPNLEPLTPKGGNIGDEYDVRQLPVRSPRGSGAAVNTGDASANASDSVSAPGCALRDALGVSRPQLGRCDRGAVERTDPLDRLPVLDGISAVFVASP